MASVGADDNAQSQGDGHFAEFAQFLTAETRSDVRKTALNYLEGISLSSEGVHLFKEKDFAIGKRLRTLFHVSPSDQACVLRIMTNICADVSDCVQFVLSTDESEPNLTTAVCGRFRTADDLAAAESAAKFLSNICLHDANGVWERLRDVWPDFVRDAVALLNKDDRVTYTDYVGYVLRNLTTVSDVRAQLVDEESVYLDLLPLINQERWPKRKRIAVDILRNICFDDDRHEQLLSRPQTLVALLTPLIGPEELSGEENDVLPIELQYMEASKAREPDVDVRLKLLETLYQLCSTKIGREHLREKGTYYVLREYHRWETNEEADRLVSGVIGVLIRFESEMCLEEGVALRDAQHAAVG